MNPLDAVRDGAYRASLSILSAWTERRHRGDFDRVERFCLFVGYPRSGHSVVGAVLNAHRDAVISHELDAPPLILAGCTRAQLYARILARAYWFNLRGNRSNYSYQVQNQWQGRFAALRVIGDKRGGAVVRCIEKHPDFLERVRSLVEVPLRLIHVVRNPFDNIAAISIWHHLSLAESVDYYFAHCRVTSALGETCDASELLTVRHEDMIRDPGATLAALGAFLGLEGYPGYEKDCRELVFTAPTYTRRKVAWTPALIGEVEQRALQHRPLEGYDFEIRPDAGR